MKTSSTYKTIFLILNLCKSKFLSVLIAVGAGVNR